MKGFFASSVVQKEAPATLFPQCGACGIFKDCDTPKMKPYGDGAKRVLIVGEAPSENDDQGGRPFLGDSGKMLRDTLARIGVRLDRDAIVTNSLICHPRHGVKVDSKHIGYCRPNLLQTIKEFNPRVVITLGYGPLSSVVQDYWKGDIGGLDRWIGWKIPLPDFWLCPTYHPAYLARMRNPMMERLFSDHLERAFAAKEDLPEPLNFAQDIEILYDDEEVWGAIRDIDQEGALTAIDYETTCLKPEYEGARIVSCAISSPSRTISYPWMGKAIKATGIFLKSTNTKKIAAHLKMEERWTLKEFGHGVEGWGWDTVVAAHCLDNRPEICSLKFQAFIKMGVCTYNETVEPYLKSTKGHLNRIDEIDIRTLLFYGGMDGILERKLAQIQMKEMGL